MTAALENRWALNGRNPEILQGENGAWGRGELWAGRGDGLWAMGHSPDLKGGGQVRWESLDAFLTSSCIPCLPLCHSGVTEELENESEVPGRGRSCVP